MTTAMHVEHVEVGALRPYARNARTHSKKQIKQIATSASSASASPTRS